MSLLGTSHSHFRANFGIIQSMETLPQTSEDMRPDPHSSKLEHDGKYVRLRHQEGKATTV